MEPGLERRHFRRYAVSFPCIAKPLRRRKSQGSLGLESETRDISRGGLFFVVPAEPKLTAEIECLIRLPIDRIVGKTIAIRCRGKVVRTVPQESGSIGVAATIEHFAFTDLV